MRSLTTVKGDHSMIDVPNSNTFTLPAGTYEMSTNMMSKRKEVFQKMTIKKISDHTYGIPFKSFFQRLKYLFTGKLKDIVIIETTFKTGVGKNEII